MKKLLIIALIVFINLESYSQSNTHIELFDKIKNKKEISFKNPERTISNSNPNKLPLSTIPTITKYSTWHHSAWLKGYALNEKYTNNNLTEYLSLSYDFDDTSQWIIYQYDNLNRISSQVEYVKNLTTGRPDPYLKITFSYSSNLNSNVRTRHFEYYNRLLNTWELKSRDITQTDSRGNIILEQSEVYQNPTWEISYGKKSNYNYLNPNSNKIIQRIDSIYNSNEYLPSKKSEYAYNSYEDKTEYIYFEYSNKWDTIEKTKIFFDINRIPKRISYYTDENQIGHLFERSRAEDIVWYNYNPDIEYFYQTALYFILTEYFDNQPVNTFKEETTVTDSYGSTETHRYYYDTFDLLWVFYFKSIYKLNSNLHELEELDYYFMDNQWVMSYGQKNYFQYDNNNNISEIIVTLYDDVVQDFVNYDKYEFSDYISINTGINTSKNTIETKLYPNPSNDGKVFVNVKMEKASELKIKVVDLTEKVVFTQLEKIGEGINTIELSNLKQGMYLIELSCEYGISRNKLIVK